MEVTKEKRLTGERLRKIRESRKCSQESFAFELGMSLTNYSKMERGEHNVALTTLNKLHDKYRVSADYMLFGEEKEPEHIMYEIQNLNDAQKLRILLRLFEYFGVEKERHFTEKRREETIMQKIERFMSEGEKSRTIRREVKQHR